MAGLKGRTLPVEFFERSKQHYLRSPQPLDIISNASSVSIASWNVCVFVDMRASSDNDLPIALLPIPEEHCIFMHFCNQFQACKRVFVLIQPQHHTLFNRWQASSNVAFISTDVGIPYSVGIKSIRDLYSSLFDSETVTLTLESSTLTEHQMLWRPLTDAYETVRFIGEHDEVIGTAWRNPIWKDHPIKEVMKVSKCSQRVWCLSNERRYLEYVCHKFNILGWK